MIVEYSAPNGILKPQLRCYVHSKLTPLDETDVPIGDVMSVPLNRLCQLTWPLMEGKRTENFCSFAAVSSFLQTGVDEARLREIINATAEDTISFFQNRRWWGHLTRGAFRPLLFQSVLRSAFPTDLMMPPEKTGEIVPQIISLTLPNVAAKEGEHHTMDDVDAMGLRAPQKRLDDRFANDKVVLIEGGLHGDKRWTAHSDCCLHPHIVAQHDEGWLLETVRKMVDMAIASPNENCRRLITNAACASLHAQSDRRCARVLLYILRDVLQRWNASLDITEGLGVFCCDVVVPILNIVRFTEFREDDLKGVGKLLSNVPPPPHGGDVDHAPLSTTTFSTRYSFSLEPDVRNKAEDEHDGTDRGLWVPSTFPLSLFSGPEITENDTILLEQLQGLDADRGDGDAAGDGDAIVSTMVTHVLFAAPLAQRVSLRVCKASCCDGVQIVFVPRAPTVTEGIDAAGARQRNEPLWFEPREGETHEFTGACDVVVRHKRAFEVFAGPVLNAEVRVETSLKVDERPMVELRDALSNVQLVVAASLVEKIKNASNDFFYKQEKILALFRNGFLSQSRSELLPQFVVDLLSLQEETLCRRVPCLRSHVRGVRAALGIIALFLSHSEPDLLSWELRVWREAVKRVSLASTLLGKNPEVTEIAEFVLHHVAPSCLTMSQIVEGTIGLLTSTVSVSELRTVLVARRERAELCVLALSLLLRAKENFVPGEMFRAVSLLRDITMYEGDHYLQRFQGCGEVLEEEIRKLVHGLLAAVFKALHYVISLPHAEGRKHVPHRFLWDTDEFGPFALVSFSLLACPLDMRDVELVWRSVSTELRSLLPDFTDFARSTSFKVKHMGENDMLETLRAVVGNNSADDDDDGDGAADGVHHCPLIGFTISGATERGLGVWVPIEQERVCSTSSPIYTPETPLPSSALTIVEARLLNAPREELVLALATESRVSLTTNDIWQDQDGFYFFPHTGKLHHKHREISLPPLFQGDVFAFCFTFSLQAGSRVLILLVNNVRLAEFCLPKRKFFLLAGVTGTSFFGNAFRLSFRLQKKKWFSAAKIEGGSNATCSHFPTCCSISTFATHVFFYFVLFCARRLKELNAQVSDDCTLPAVASAPAGVCSDVLQDQKTWRGILNECLQSLQQGLEKVVASIQRLPPVSETCGATWRVKRNAALLVYCRFIRRFITIFCALDVNSALSSMDIFLTLAKVVRCEDVGERERCAALTVLCSLLRGPNFTDAANIFHPTRLWECCSALARRVTVPAYRPVFTPETVPKEIVVCSGGRRIRSVTAPDGTLSVTQKTISFASQGILLNGSMGDVVSFSVRLQRQRSSDGLNRYYYVGVACPCPFSTMTTLSRHPGNRQEMGYVYAITDHCSDISYLTARLELQRHSKHWVSKEEGIIFGSGDVITVIVHTKLRCISFERNGMSLGTLFSSIPPIVNVLFPFVELFNGDASAIWMHVPREIGIWARFTMREMLRHWDSELIPQLKRMIEANDVLALELLGADGDEMSFFYRHPPRSEMRGSSVVRLVRRLGSKAEVTVEDSSRNILVSVAALESNYDTVISRDMPVFVVVDNLIHILSTSLTFITNVSGHRSVQIRRVKMFVLALRLLSEMDVVCLPSHSADIRRDLLGELIRLLEVQDATSCRSQHIILEAWNELMMLSDDEGICIPIFQDTQHRDETNEEQDGDAEDVTDLCLHCPHCGKEWGSCTSEDHVAPYSLCFSLHCVLKRLGVPSPFTGFACEWFLAEKHTHITLRVEETTGKVEGEGKDTHGLFTFAGKLVTSNTVRGRCVYRHAENIFAKEVIDEEWTCEACTFINVPDSIRCAICTTARPGATWTCVLCGYVFNSKSDAICTTCGHQRVDAAETDVKTDTNWAYCEGCGRQREYTTFDSFDCLFYCDFCQCTKHWFPKEKYTSLVEAVLTGAGDTMKWVVTLGNATKVYSNLRNSSYSLEELQQATEGAFPGASDLSAYVPPFAQVFSNDSETSVSLLAKQRKEKTNARALVQAILFFSTCIVCRWSLELSPRLLANRSVLCCLRLFDVSWLTGLENTPIAVARAIFCSVLKILLCGTNSEQVIRSLSLISRVAIKSHPALHKQRHYLLYAFCLSALRCNGDRGVRELSYSALNALLEEFADQPLNVRCLQDVMNITPILPGQQQLMVHAALRGLSVFIGAHLTPTGWLIGAVKRMEQQQRLPVLFDEELSDCFPYLVELPDTRVGNAGELIVGQVRGSVGVCASKGGCYYYEVVMPENISNDRVRTIVMGWGTMRHEVLNSGQHVGSDIYSWGFNCQDRLRTLGCEQTMPTPRPIVAGDVIGALLNFETMMMSWSVNGEQLMWVVVPTQGKDEAIYPFVSASTDSQGVVVRLGHTEFKPRGFEDFSLPSPEMVRRESAVEPRSYEYYVQLCNLGHNMVNCGFTTDSLLDTTAWFDHAQAVIRQYPLLDEETAAGKILERLRPYLQHLRSINALAVSVAKCNEMFSDSPHLMSEYQKVCRLLFFSARWAIVERQIDRYLVRRNMRRHNEVTIDLNRAKSVAENCENLSFAALFEGSITGQIFQQTKDADIHHDSVLFVTNLAGEVADDAGGVTRSVLTMMCDELNYCEKENGGRMRPMLPFFRLTSHTTMVTVVPNMEFYRETPECRPLFLDFFLWFGKLFGNATLSGHLTFSLSFPRLVWKFFTFDEATMEDYYADIDDTVRGALNDDAFLLNDDFFYAITGVRRHEDVLPDPPRTQRSLDASPTMSPVRGVADPGGFLTADESEENSTTATRRREAAEQALLRQFDELLLAMRSGITSAIPARSLRLIRWDDLQQRVCGNAGATAEDVIASLNLSLLSEELCQMLKDVVRDWSRKKRSEFLLFCSGQRRVPLPEKVQVSCGDDPQAIPTAHTCSPISLLLQPYVSASVMREKLEICLHHMYEFGLA